MGNSIIGADGNNSTLNVRVGDTIPMTIQMVSILAVPNARTWATIAKMTSAVVADISQKSCPVDLTH